MINFENSTEFSVINFCRLQNTEKNLGMISTLKAKVFGSDFVSKQKLNNIEGFFTIYPTAHFTKNESL